MKKNIFILINAFVLIFLIGLTSVSAYYPYYNSYYGYGADYGYGRLPTYHYYDEGDAPEYRYPDVFGPFPREYLWHKDADDGFRYVHDDFDGYDSFVGYKDLDVFYPHLGIQNMIRNPNSEPLDLSQLTIPEGVKTFGNHVHGFIPYGGEYVKHYHHDHEWEIEEYNYGYGYYTPFLAYQNKPVYTNPCQSISACQYRYCSAC